MQVENISFAILRILLLKSRRTNIEAGIASFECNLFKYVYNILMDICVLKTMPGLSVRRKIFII